LRLGAHHSDLDRATTITAAIWARPVMLRFVWIATAR